MELGYEGLVRGNGVVDLGAVVVVVGKGSVDFAQSKRVRCRDLVGLLAHSRVPDYDVLDGDSVASDVRLASADSGSDLDMCQGCGCHRGSPSCLLALTTTLPQNHRLYQ